MLSSISLSEKIHAKRERKAISYFFVAIAVQSFGGITNPSLLPYKAKSPNMKVCCYHWPYDGIIPGTNIIVIILGLINPY